MTKYYHLVPFAEWEACKSSGREYVPATYEQDGFTHLSDNKDVLVTIGNHFYKQIEGSYLVLEIEGAKLSSEVKLEPAAPVGSTEPHKKISEQLFPHLYGPINFESVVKELRVERKEDGTFLGLVGE